MPRPGRSFFTLRTLTPFLRRSGDSTPPLAGRSSIVTGASKGIGLEIARALAAAGARVAMLARSRDLLAAHAAELGVRALPVVCDVTDSEAVSAAVIRLERDFGGAADILVSNAGLFMLAPVVATRPEDFNKSLQVNLASPFLLVRSVLPAMLARGSGHIVTIGSVADRTVYPENAAYAAAKHGLRALHEVLRAELRGTGVRATLVSPGPTDTTLWDGPDPDSREGFTPRSAMLRSQAVADAVLWAVTRPESVNVDELRLSRA